MRGVPALFPRIVPNVTLSSDLEQEEQQLGGAEFSPDLNPFVGNLPFSVDSAQLASPFQQAGSVEMVERQVRLQAAATGKMVPWAKHWMRLVAASVGGSAAAVSSPCLHRLPVARFSHRPLYEVKVGISEFLKAVGNGVEAHIAKLETEIRDFEKLLVTRTLCLKKLGIPCKHRKLILRYTHKYRLGLWRPRADAIK